MLKRTGTRLMVSLLFVLFIDDAVAGDVYRWVDENGLVHFSQWAPGSQVTEVSTVEIDTSTPQDYDPHDDPYSILNQSARIHELWSALQAEKEEARENARELADSRTAPFREQDYFFAPFRFGHFAHFRSRDVFGVQRKQLKVLDEFDRLQIPGAVSINSSWHRARVAGQQRVFRDVIRGSDH